MINEFDTPEERTKNYNKYCELLISEIGIQDIVELANDLDTTNSIEELVMAIKDWKSSLLNISSKFITTEKCPHCNVELYLSDLPQYDYLCIACDENF